MRSSLDTPEDRVNNCHPCTCTPERSCAAHFDAENEIWYFECQDCGLSWLSVWNESTREWIRALNTPPIESGTQVFVKFPRGVWEAGVVIGDIPGNEGEEFRRLNVVLDDGRELRCCHPGCVVKTDDSDRNSARWIFTEVEEQSIQTSPYQPDVQALNQLLSEKIV